MSLRKHASEKAARSPQNFVADGAGQSVRQYSPPKQSEQYKGIVNKNPNPSGWTSINKTIYEGLMEQDFYPPLYYTQHDPGYGINGTGYTEDDETVLHKLHNKETRPLG